MSVFRVERISWASRLWQIALAGGLVFAPALAAAADGPKPILPRGYGGVRPVEPAPTAPKPLPGTGSGPAPVEVPRKPGTRGADIEVGVLSSPKMALLGLIGSDAPGGLGRDLWAGTASPTAARLLAAMPAASRSPAMASLLHRLLLTRAAAPQGDPGAFTLARFQALLGTGLLDETVRMGGALGDPARAEPIAGIVASAALYAGDQAEACRYRVPNPDGSESAFALKLRAICEILAGRKHAARLVGDVMQETGIEAPLFYGALAGVLYPGEPAPKALATELPGPAEWALLSMTSVRPTPGRLGAYGPALLAAIARSGPGPTPEATAIALGAAELAWSIGALDARTTRAHADRLLEAGPLDEGALEGLEPHLRPVVDAARDAHAAQNDTDLVNAIYTALSSARNGSAFIRAARFFIQDIMILAPEEGHIWAAPTLARACLAAGEPDRAAIWNQLYESAPFAAGDAKSHASEIRRLRALMIIKGSEVAPIWRFSEAEAWFASAERGEAARERVALEMKILDALGYQMRPDLRARADATVPLRTRYKAPKGTLTALRRASLANRRGETIALAATAFAGGSAQSVADETLLAAVEALDRAGLEEDARALAFEALVHDGGR